jgi:hypothetical protein
MGLAEASPHSTISLIEIKTKLKPEARKKKKKKGQQPTLQNGVVVSLDYFIDFILS